ncbi:MAG: rod shape-determining protein MreC [Leptonema sp. (in: bacteria)]
MLWEYIQRYKTFFSLSFCIIFSLISLLWQKNPFTYSTLYFAKISEQTNSFFKNLFNFPLEVVQRISEYSILKDKYEKALEELEKYKSQKEGYEILLKENQKLRELLNFEHTTIYPEIKAQVLGIRLNSITPRIIINKGSAHNIKPFMPVIAYTNEENNIPIRAVVGISAIVQENTTIVQPIQHPQTKLGVKIENTNQWAILQGNSYSLRLLKLKYISKEYENSKVFFSDTVHNIFNSKIVTSGNDGVFPPNILVGRITNETDLDEEGFNVAYVEPYISLDKLDFVIVIIKEPEEWIDRFQEEDTNVLKTPFSEEIVPEHLLSMKNKEEKKKEESKKEEKNQSDLQEKKQKDLDLNPSGRRIILNPNDPLQQ